LPETKSRPVLGSVNVCRLAWTSATVMGIGGSGRNA
jgi:hypothetical protein